MNETWVRIVSWHALSGLVSRVGMRHTRCGRWTNANAEVSEELPAGKSCEVCLRAIARAADGRDAEGVGSGVDL